MKTKLLPLVALLSMAGLTAPVMAQSSDIASNDKGAYIVDSNGNIVRDGFGGCVRSIDWTKETAIAKCEGWEEAKPEPVVVAPAPAPVVETIVEGVPASFLGFFDTDKTILKPAAKEKLDEYAGYMTRNMNKNITVKGHTDSTGSDSYNQGLSERRAAAVKNYLVSKGINGNRIATSGYGESMPVASNKTKDGRAQNRRVEIEVLINNN